MIILHIFLKAEDLAIPEKDTIIIKGVPVPKNWNGMLVEFEFRVEKGCVKASIEGKSNVDIIRDIDSNTNGIGRTFLDEEDRVIITSQNKGDMCSCEIRGVIYTKEETRANIEKFIEENFE